MPSFDDNNGRTWVVEINVNTIKRVRSLTDCDLLDTEDGNILMKLSSDPILLCDVLFAVCQPQAEEREISDVSFGEALYGDAIADGTEALLEALANFFPGRRGDLLRNTLQKMKGVETAHLDRVETILQSGRLEKAMQAELEKNLQELTPGGSSTRPPESSE